ncbi:MAG: apolipoprotein N-acyltransferase [Akkermansiaceae bacterium]|nr:apolipoprotein N-acyltransferase [Akkermansiaceae bacterium]
MHNTQKTEMSGGQAAAAPRSWALDALVSLGSGVVMALAFPPYDWGHLVWVALLPLLSVLWRGRISRKRAFAMGWLYGMGWYCVSFWWIHEVGNTFGIHPALFMAVAFVPLMALYSCLPGVWALLAATCLRPRLEPGPEASDLPAERRKQLWRAWEWADMFSTLRSAVGCGAAWVCIEWLRAHGTLGFSWNSMGMALYDGLSFVQWAEFVGTAALSFIPVFTSVVLWGAFRRTVMVFKGTGIGCRPWDFYGTVVLLFGLFAGGLALSKAYSPLTLLRKEGVLPLPVMAVQLNKDQQEHILEGRQVSQYREYLNATVAAYNSIARETMQRAMKSDEVGLVMQLPVWVVWPESALPFPFYRAESTHELLPDVWNGRSLFGEQGLPLARERVRELGGENFVLFTGVDELLLQPLPDGDGHFPVGMLNSMACITGGQDSVQTVSKQHLMPFGEYLPLVEDIAWLGQLYSEITGTQVGEGIRPGSGTEPLVVPVPGSSEHVGVIPAVCYEDTVGDLLRRFVRPGAQVIVNGSNDAWFRNSSCGVQQARVAAFRCIELRRPMIRAANMGVNCAIAPNGAVMHALLKADGTPHLPGYSYAVLPVDTHGGYTLYALLGDWAVGVCALLVLLLGLSGWWSRRRCKA